MSEEAFQDSIKRAVAEVVSIEGLLKRQEAAVAETKDALDLAHKRVREKERDLKEFRDAHEGETK